MGWNFKVQGGGYGFDVRFNNNQWKKAIRQAKKDAPRVLGEAVAKVLTEDMANIRAALKRRGVAGSAMDKIGDSLIVEMGTEKGGADTMVRAGSEPVDAGGVTGSRGGKIAIYYEYGVPSFNYPWAIGKEVESSALRGGTGFINMGRNSRHPGFKKAFGAKGWLTEWYDRSIPRMKEAIENAMEREWGGR